MDKPYTDTREHLLATGEAIILGKGFAAVGLAEILSSAGVPKGSFYHYFRSKEGFGVEMLERYFAQYAHQLQHLIVDRCELSARDRLLAYFGGWIDRQCDMPSQSCLAVKLAGEVSDLSEPMREALSRGMTRVIEKFAACLRDGVLDGSILTDQAPEQLAANLYAFWVGSALLAKVQHSAEPMKLALIQSKHMLSGEQSAGNH
ncbi:TetR/AcrR family transcriptional regulator [Burkholderiaceae bacterium DAT-1]|nr:TetR/AcrR family transcriptional regulator [Burkholderiaceae bacterium DAT-1]